MQSYPYKSYKEYLEVQYETNKPRISWTVQKSFVRAEDISIIEKHFKGKRCVCIGCRHDKEVEDFIDAGFDAIGIDILPTERQIIGDFNKLENYFKNESFDFAYSCHTLEHTNDPIHFLRMIRKICTEGLYLVIPIRENPDVEEPIFFDVMHTMKTEDLVRELSPALGNIFVEKQLIRNNPSLPSGAEMAFLIKWN
ncbi:MAG: methyltransferase domain-containing protein [Ignavibacteriales bacterium]|nr:methyltransferase domain-containing protein [Ignavibacteriales bacterium]